MRKWHKRLLIFLLILAFAAINVFAQGLGEVIAGAFTTVIGLGISVLSFGGAAAIGGMMMGAGIGMIGSGASYMAGEDKRKLEEQNKLISAYNDAFSNYTNAQTQVATLEGAIADTEVNILQTEADISAFDQTLVRWQSQYDIQRNQLQMEGESAYSQLMQNWQGAELVNATRGQAGGSAALVAESQAMQIERLAGKDMKLDENGGLFGTSLNEFRLDMLAGRNEIVGNMKISQEALVKYNSALSSYKSSLATAQTNLSNAYQQLQVARTQATNAGVNPSLVGA